VGGDEVLLRHALEREHLVDDRLRFPLLAELKMRVHHVVGSVQPLAGIRGRGDLGGHPVRGDRLAPGADPREDVRRRLRVAAIAE
jgi:hypothetical protein